MSETKWTAGPWRVDPDLFLAQGYTAISAEHHYGLAQVVSRMDYAEDDDEYNATLEANARLIAAAPELYEALEGLEEAYCRAGDGLTKAERHEDRMRLIAARAARAKARGEA